MTSSFNEVNSSITACELPFAGGWIPYQAAAPGVGLLRYAQLRHTTESVLAQTVTQPTRQVLQVSSTLVWPVDVIIRAHSWEHITQVFSWSQSTKERFIVIEMIADRYQ